jgi:hypothetical protein
LGLPTQTSSALDKVGAITKELNQTTKMRLEELMQWLVEHLKEDFEALDRTVAILSGEMQEVSVASGRSPPVTSTTAVDAVKNCGLVWRRSHDANYSKITKPAAGTVSSTALPFLASIRKDWLT